MLKHMRFFTMTVVLKFKGKSQEKFCENSQQSKDSRLLPTVHSTVAISSSNYEKVTFSIGEKILKHLHKQKNLKF